MLTYVVKFLFTLRLMDFTGDGYLSGFRVAFQNFKRIVSSHAMNKDFNFHITTFFQWILIGIYCTKQQA
jgi:hypothetical protein